MGKPYQFKRVEVDEKIRTLQNSCLANFTSPQDGMWYSIINQSPHWEIRDSDDLIGFACTNAENVLLQFYLLPQYLPQGLAIFKKFIEQREIKQGIVGTNNPQYLSLALHFVDKVKVHTYLFGEDRELVMAEKEGVLNECHIEDLDRLVDFCHLSMGAPITWLRGYISGLIEQGEIFVFQNKDKILGTCEVRRSKSSPKYADLGMIVSPEFRKMGYGTYLLNRAKGIAKSWALQPICSCEKDNVASLKSIQQCGFVSTHRLIMLDFLAS